METSQGPVERAAAWLREVPGYVWDGVALPVPVEDIADSHCDLLVREVSPEAMLRAPGVPPLEEGASLSGLLLLGPGEIWVNAEEAQAWPGRRRFTVGHELGHWVLHRPSNSVFCRATCPDPEPATPDIEEQASLFASVLMFPPDLVRGHYARFDGDLARMCETFGASKRATERAILEAVRKPLWAGVEDVLLFHYDDPGYEAWREARRDDGLVLNDDLADGARARLHRASCSYLDRPVQEGVPRTRYPKWCATEPPELLEIVPRAQPCGRCRPPGAVRR